MANDNEKFLERFISCSKGFFEVTTLKDNLILSNNTGLTQSFGMTHLMNFHEDAVYIDFHGEMAKAIDVEDMAYKTDLGAFYSGYTTLSNDDLVPYWACILGKDPMSFGLANEIISARHRILQKLDKISFAPDLPIHNNRVLTIDGVTALGKTKLENQPLNTYRKLTNSANMVIDALEL